MASYLSPIVQAYTSIVALFSLGVLAEVSVTEQVLRKISKFPEILGKLSMHKHCVPGSLSSFPVQEPGNEATGYCSFATPHCE